MKRIFNSLIKRPAKNFNVENRAQKVIEKRANIPHAAPKHPTTVQHLEKFSKEHPELLDEQKRKDEDLHKRLEGMVVNPDKVGEIHSRPLPTDRSKFDEPEFGYLEPTSVPEGKCSIKQAVTFISAHSVNRDGYTAKDIAKEYKLDIKQVEDVLKYFHMYQVQTPKDPTKYESDSSSEAVIPPTVTAKKLSDTEKSALPPGSEKNR